MNLRQVGIEAIKAVGLVILGNLILFTATTLIMLTSNIDFTVALILLLGLKLTLMIISTYIIGKGVWRLKNNGK